MDVQKYITMIGKEVTFLDKTQTPYAPVTGVFGGIAITSPHLSDLEFYVDCLTYALRDIESLSPAIAE